ncbi:MAG: hypothetical protein NW223_24295 [Hyphomicrobiaceae bacterium]|nr:hypothetical protein [Hyphomicrobiaceae bacterium]
MTLGHLIAELEHEETGARALEALGDIVLFSEVQAMGEAFGESVAAYVATAAGRFAALAGDEAWLGLVGAMEQAAAPGQVALRRMLRWALDQDARELAGPAPSNGCACGRHDCA